jgi:hypothetical protein
MSSSRISVDLIGHLLAASDKQHSFLHFVRGINWSLDLVEGFVSFGSSHRWRIVALGRESLNSDTWIWSWADPTSNTPNHLLAASLNLKEYGEQHGISEFSDSHVLLSQINSHTLALLASSLCKANAYHACPYDGGTIFVMIIDETFPKFPYPICHRIVSIFPQIFTSFDIPNHRLALTTYLSSHDLNYHNDDRQILVKKDGINVLTATFDEQNRLTTLETEMDADEEPPVESWEESQLNRMLRG